MKHCPVCKAKAVELDKDACWRCHKCNAFQKRGRLPSKVKVWARGRGWFLRLLGVFLIALLLQQLIQHPKLGLVGQANPFSYVDLGFHELGHLLFTPFGEFMHVAGGSIWQLIMPLAWIIVSAWKRWYFATVVCLAWLGSSLFGVAAYARDAVLAELSLLSLSGDEATTIHDWEYLFTKTNHFYQKDIFATADFIQKLGIMCLVTSIVLGIALVVTILVVNRRAETK